MLENAIYSVITPEGCASILWKDGGKAAQAAEVMRLSAMEILDLKVADEVVPEPMGGAHREPEGTAENLGVCLRRQLAELAAMSPEQLITQRYEKYRAMGAFLER
jgi:acetyl-CoA carboxylase carboxyl transferase subunit alpha